MHENRHHVAEKIDFNESYTFSKKKIRAACFLSDIHTCKYTYYMQPMFSI